MAEESNAGFILVVLGAHADQLKKEVDGTKAMVVENSDWQEGMASSIRCGIATLTEMSPNTAGAILMVCDQPYVTSSLLNDLLKAHLDTGKPIVTCSYANTFGPPAFFYKNLFPELLSLTGDVGARSVIRQHANEVAVVLFQKGRIDIDTEKDFENLEKENRINKPE